MSVNVLVPDRWGGLAVCDLAQLVACLDDEEGLEDAVTNSAFDTIDISSRYTHEQIRNNIGRVQRLNDEPSWGGYWDTVEP